MSGTGLSGYNNLLEEYKENVNIKVPHICVFIENGYTKDKKTIINETHKILHDDNIKSYSYNSEFYSHSKSINV